MFFSAEVGVFYILHLSLNCDIVYFQKLWNFQVAMWKTESDSQETRGDTIIFIAGRNSADVVLPLLIAPIALITIIIFSCILGIQPSDID